MPPSSTAPVTTSDPVVRGRGLTKAFGSGRARRTVLDGVDIELRGGELVAIVGPSGSGKSTLLHVLGGLDRPDAGSVQLCGEAVTGRGEAALSSIRRRYVGVVFQAFHLLPELSGEANVMLPAQLPGAAPGAVARAGALVDRLGLRTVAASRPAQLSGGEQQRFAIARALVNDPKLLLADEPTGNLDAASGASVLALLRELANGDGRAILVVTHEASVAAAADRVLQMRDGRLAP